MTTPVAAGLDHDAPPSGDGRSAIRDRNRDAVLDAVLALFSEDNLFPGPEDVAARTGLSVRSVYRYFEDREALVRTAIARHLDLMRPLFHVEAIGKGTLADRIDRLVSGRLRLYEVAKATHRAARIRAAFDVVVGHQLDVGRQALRDQVARHFATEFEGLGVPRGRARLCAIDTLVQFESLDNYRFHRRCSSSDTRLLLIDAVGGLLET